MTILADEFSSSEAFSPLNAVTTAFPLYPGGSERLPRDLPEQANTDLRVRGTNPRRDKLAESFPKFWDQFAVLTMWVGVGSRIDSLGVHSAIVGI
jgi:hypothetical protein